MFKQITRLPFQKVGRVLVPLVFWALTAAPTFVNDSDSSGLQKLSYAYIHEPAVNLQARLFEDQSYKPVIDTAVENIYIAISANKLNEALAATDTLIKEFPNFHLGYLFRGDILSLKAGRSIRGIGDVRSHLSNSKKLILEDLREEAIARFKAVKDRPQKDLLPSELVELNHQQKYVILVDAARSRLFLYENTFPYPRLVTDFYVSQGRMGAVKSKTGDKKTPIGVYRITELLPKEKLSDFYGPIALPIDYPNTWDKRLGKTGFGIWLHGMPENYASRPPKSSDGCVVLANQDLLALKQYVDIGQTSVVISERLDFVTMDIWLSHRKAALSMVASWKEDIEKSFANGISHYANNVVIDGQDLMDWQRSTQINDKSFGEIKIKDLTVLRYPSDKDMMFITFKQEDNLFGKMQKEQYWMKTGTRWQIVQEDTVKL